jgi:ribose 5-phosphate isomerase B
MLYIVADHAGFEIKTFLLEKLTKTTLEFIDLTPELQEGDDYPDVATILADKIKSEIEAGHSPKGIALCGSGQGICMALNRHPHIRAATALKREIVRLSRLHNDANVLCLPGAFINTTKAVKLVKVFANTPFSKIRRHERRIEKLSPKIETK